MQLHTKFDPVDFVQWVAVAAQLKQQRVRRHCRRRQWFLAAAVLMLQFVYVWVVKCVELLQGVGVWVHLMLERVQLQEGVACVQLVLERVQLQSDSSPCLLYPTHRAGAMYTLAIGSWFNSKHGIIRHTQRRRWRRHFLRFFLLLLLGCCRRDVLLQSVQCKSILHARMDRQFVFGGLLHPDDCLSDGVYNVDGLDRCDKLRTSASPCNANRFVDTPRALVQLRDTGQNSTRWLGMLQRRVAAYHNICTGRGRTLQNHLQHCNGCDRFHNHTICVCWSSIRHVILQSPEVLHPCSRNSRRIYSSRTRLLVFIDQALQCGSNQQRVRKPATHGRIRIRK